MALKEEKYCNNVIAVLVSGIAHAGLVLTGIMCCNFSVADHVEEFLLNQDTEIMEMLPESDPEPLPEPPQTDELPPPVEEPPVVEPPPPVEEPPVVEPPPPEIPKIIPKADPEPVKPDPPKEKPEPPKEKPKSRAERIREQLERSKVIKPKNPPPVAVKPVKPVRATSADDIRKRLQGTAQPRTSRTVRTGGSRIGNISSERDIRVNYAEKYVKPLYYEHWTTPAVGNSRPTSVIVSLQVASDGRVVSARITRYSNDERMNSSVKDLIEQVRQFASFASVGIKATMLDLTVELEIHE